LSCFLDLDVFLPVSLVGLATPFVDLLRPINQRLEELIEHVAACLNRFHSIRSLHTNDVSDGTLSALKMQCRRMILIRQCLSHTRRHGKPDGIIAAL